MELKEISSKRIKLMSIEKINKAKSNPRWNDWIWQYNNRINSVEKLEKIFDISAKEKSDIGECLTHFRMSITPYFASLIKEESYSDPIFMQCVPSALELDDNSNDLFDPLNEDGDSPVPHIVHRYPDRVLFLITLCCSTYCRHCTRRRHVGERDGFITEKQFQIALDYIRSHEEIRDVLISGGDPLVMSDDRLEHIIAGIRSIKHVEVIRIGTRVPCVMPMRITDDLVNMLKKYHPLWMNLQFNHPNEVTPDSIAACNKLADAGIPLGNQSVLLKGVNDKPEIIRELCTKMVQLRVRPYYLYQCDLSQGISHFRTNVDVGIDIIHSLQGFISGFAIPKFVIDAPGGGGKVPINYNYLISKDDKEVVFENYKGLTYRYPQPKIKK